MKYITSCTIDSMPLGTNGAKRSKYASHAGGHEDGQMPEPISLDDAEEELSDTSVIMAVSSSGSKLGIAVYERASNAVLVFQGQEEGKGPFKHQLIHLIKQQVNPSVIYASTKSDPELLAALKHRTGESPHEAQSKHKVAADDSKEDGMVPVKLERASAFHYDQALQRLKQLHVASHESSNHASREHLALLNTMVDLSKDQQVCALGGLLLVVSKAHNLGSDNPLTVNSLSELNLQSCLVVDPASLAALQIVQEECHASRMGIGSSREGCSLYGLLNKCVTHMGRTLLRSWLLRPVIDMTVLNDRLNTVECLAPVPGLCGELHATMTKVADVNHLLLKLQSTQAQPDIKSYIKLKDSLLQMLQLRGQVVELLNGEQQQHDGNHSNRNTSAGSDNKPCWSDLGIVNKLLEHLGQPLLSAYGLINAVIDTTDQCEEGWCITAGVCQELDDLKATYQGLPDLLTRVLESELARVPASLARLYSSTAQQQHRLWSITYLPQIGYAIQVTCNGLPDEVLEVLPDYQHAFELDGLEGNTVFYSTDSTRELSKRFGDLLYKISDLEASLCSQLLQRLTTHSCVLQTAANTVATLDCLVSFALVSAQLRYCKPVLTTENVCVIKAGRHPLAEIMTSHTYIPNDTSMGKDSNRVHIITGPNASGKSCYAKQVALITFMAHIGCFVPAESAIIGLTDRIFARSVMGESVAAMTSSFAADVSQISRMVHHATDRSLLIIDEFGKGTLAADGVGLLSSLISHLCEGNNQQGAATSPRVLACTHYHELLDEQVLPRHPCLQFYTMEVITEANDNSKMQSQDVRSAGAPMIKGRQDHKGHQQQDVTFLYRLVEGYCAPSFGISCARLCGVREDVVARAQQVLQVLESKQPIQAAAQALDGPRCQLYRKAVQEATNASLLDPSHSQQRALSYLLGLAVNESLLSATVDDDD